MGRFFWVGLFQALRARLRSDRPSGTEAQRAKLPWPVGPKTRQIGRLFGDKVADRKFPKRKTGLWEPNVLRLPNTIWTKLVPNNDDLQLLADQNGVTYVQLVPGHARAGAAKSWSALCSLF
jgi:hypothetical protein